MSVTPLYPAKKYTYRVLWAEDQQRYVGVCTEFAALSYLATTAEAALEGIIARVANEIDEKLRAKDEVPLPLSVKLLGKEYR